MWTLCLVFDHRLVMMALRRRFLQHIKQVIEEPYLLWQVERPIPAENLGSCRLTSYPGLPRISRSPPSTPNAGSA
jgi:hypothetical protein